jgi:hypothetical protein
MEARELGLRCGIVTLRLAGASMKHTGKAKRASGQHSTPAPRRQRVPATVLIIVAVGVAAAAAFWWWRGQKLMPTQAAPAIADTVAPTATTASATSEFSKLVGRWLRPDGGYVIEVRGVEENGRMQAAYFNPNPIHVAKAEASREGTVTKVFLELRDVNYPGCTYALAYDPNREMLFGVYFQAALQQNFDVVFVRAK